MKKLLSITEFNNLNADISEYNKRDIQEAEILTADISKHWPAELFIYVTESNRFEGTQIYLKHPDYKFRINYWPQYKKYYVLLEDFALNEDLDHHKKSAINARFKDFEPQKMGVLNKAKIQKHIDFEIEVHKVMQEEAEQIKLKKAAFRQRLKEIEENGILINWHKDLSAGWIDRNDIQYSFSIQTSFIDERIELKNHGGGLDKFLLLSNNDLNKNR